MILSLTSSTFLITSFIILSHSRTLTMIWFHGRNQPLVPPPVHMSLEDMKARKYAGLFFSPIVGIVRKCKFYNICIGIHSMCSILKELALLICDSNLESIKIAILQKESIWEVSENNLGTMPQLYFFQMVSLIIGIAELHFYLPPKKKIQFEKQDYKFLFQKISNFHLGTK